MKIFLCYLKNQVKQIVLLILFTVIFGITFYLYKLPLGAVFYPALMYFVIIATWGALDYIKFYSKHKVLENLKNEITISFKNLPTASSLIEEDYHKLLEIFENEQRELYKKSDERYDSLINYYTTWVHQIKTPISAMHLLLQDDNSTKSEIKSELFKIEQYVDMVLTYLRLDGEGNDYLIKNYDLDNIIKQALRKFAAQFIRKKNITLRYSPLNYQVITDEKWLLFVVEQILSNALKYTKSGYINIYMENDDLIISDTGIGIEKSDINRIFSYGYTGLNGRESKKASGLGLYLCKRICDNLNHEISLSSQMGKGTIVKINLKRPRLTF